MFSYVYNLVNPFYDLFLHVCMSPDSPVSHTKTSYCCQMAQLVVEEIGIEQEWNSPSHTATISLTDHRPSHYMVRLPNPFLK